MAIDNVTYFYRMIKISIVHVSCNVENIKKNLFWLWGILPLVVFS